MAQVFSCEFWENFKNTFFTEHLWTTASVYTEAIIYCFLKQHKRSEYRIEIKFEKESLFDKVKFYIEKLFGATNIVKISGKETYVNSGYGIAF